MKAVVNAEEMRQAELESAASGLSLDALMRIAAHGASEHLLDHWGSTSRFLILAGPGNNGGDALVMAQLLHQAGASVAVFTYRRRQTSPTDLSGLPLHALDGDADAALFAKALEEHQVLVDGVLGTGRARPIEPDLAAILASVRRVPHRPWITALDLPTGVDASTGAVDEATLAADETLTFGYVKRGLLLWPAKGYCGEVTLVDIGLPARPRVTVAASVPSPLDVAGWLPHREPLLHKYQAGAVLALAGSPGYMGAPMLATTAAFRAGAGYVTLATNQSVADLLATRLLEATLIGLPDDPDQALRQLAETASRYQALLIGPGLGRSPATAAMVVGALDGRLIGPKAAVVDADALYALGAVDHWWARVAIPLVLTPHVGEMARLTAMDGAVISADRVGTAARFAREWGQVVVLKGSPTVVADPAGSLSLNPTGNPLLATAGTGDVLAGIIAALLAGGASPYDAARAGVYLHGLAADLAVTRYGDRGMMASDLFSYLPTAIVQILGPSLAVKPSPRYGGSVVTMAPEAAQSGGEAFSSEPT